MEIQGLADYFDFKHEEEEEEEGEDVLQLSAGAASIVIASIGQGEGVKTISEKDEADIQEELRRRKSRERRREKKAEQGIERRLSNNSEKLEYLFSSEIEVESGKQRTYFNLLKLVMGTLTTQMKQVSPEFSSLFVGIYCGGSFFDGLKTDSQSQEFDMNILFQFNPGYFHLRQLGRHKGKENFCFLCAGGPRGFPSSHRRPVRCRFCVGDCLSPLKMFNLLLSTVDKVLSRNRHMLECHNGLQYRITRCVGAPVTLKVKGLNNDIEFEVDLVPAVRMPAGKLYHFSDTSNRIQCLRRRFGGFKDRTNNFLAISLHRADKEKFELDFHDLERQILNRRGCVKKVIMLLKYLRDIQMGAMDKIWSHLIKVGVFRHQEITHRDISDVRYAPRPLHS